jgi:acetylglutamate kinase
MLAIERKGVEEMDGIVVIKCGGSTLSQLTDRFYENIKQLKSDGWHPVIVHGGGPEIKKLLQKLNVKSEFINGLRKTTKEVMEVVEMVLAGKVNKSVVNHLNQNGLNAVGLSGCDGQLLKAVPRDINKLGYVGDVEHVNTDLIEQLLLEEYVPVIAPVGVGRDGLHYNINADSAAGAIAVALQSEQLVFVTDVPGIIKQGELVKEISNEEVQNLIKDGTIYGGMIPKVEAALLSLKGSLKEVMIIDGKQKGAMQDGKLFGTTIKKAVEVE